jgi:hypothetical protein
MLSQNNGYGVTFWQCGSASSTRRQLRGVRVTVMVLEKRLQCQRNGHGVTE